MTNTWRIRPNIFTRGGKILAVLVLLVLFLPKITLAQSSDQNWLDYYDWYISSFDSHVVIDPDASFVVTETIDVYYNAERHGMYREIPVTYQDTWGSKVTIGLDLLSVRQDGGQATYTTYRSGPNFVVKIGDADFTITGAHEYEITYRVERAVLYFDDSDELYWNVTGTDWDAPIFDVTAMVELPSGTEPINVSCYTGFYGSTRQNCQNVQEDNLIAFAADDFLTVAVSFPKGVVYEPTKIERLLWFLQDNWPAAIALCIILFVIQYWWRRGKDPRDSSSIVAEYVPPDKIEAVYAGLLAFGRIKKDLLTAMIVQMAVDGYLHIKVDDAENRKNSKKLKGVSLIQVKAPGDLDTAHQLLFEMLFGKKTTVELSKLKGTIPQDKMQELHRTLYRTLVDRGWYVNHSFTRQTVMLVIAGILGVASIGLGAVFGLFVGMSFFFAAIIMGIFAFFMPKPTADGIHMKKRVLGFKEFMHTAERYRAQWHEEEQMFTNYLPYAIAFDDVQRWAKTFEGVHTAQPDWYESNLPFNVAIFSTQFSGIQSALTIATAPKAPSGGGSGGGGFSGGGFGGGGGGSW